MKIKEKCVTDGCVRDGISRGLCQTCYVSAKKIVDSGKYSWEELARLGMAAFKRSGGGLFNNVLRKKHENPTS